MALPDPEKQAAIRLEDEREAAFKAQNIAGAINWIKQGATVIDLIPDIDKKMPYGSWDRAVSNEEKVIELFNKNPRPIIGILNGKSGYLTVDIDEKVVARVVRDIEHTFWIGDEFLSEHLTVCAAINDAYTDMRVFWLKHVVFMRGAIHEAFERRLDRWGASKVLACEQPSIRDACRVNPIQQLAGNRGAVAEEAVVYHLLAISSRHEFKFGVDFKRVKSA